MEALWLLIAVSLSLWIYRDAGSRPEVRWMGPAAWSLSTLVLFPVTIPLYLWARVPQAAPATDIETTDDPPPSKPYKGRGAAMVAVCVAFGLGLFMGQPSKASRGFLFPQPPVTALVVQVDGRKAANIRVDGIQYWVGAARSQSLIRHQVDATKASGVFVVIDLAVASDGPTPRLVPSSRMFLRDGRGQRYSTSLEGETALLFQTGKSLFLEPAQPHLRRWGQVVFDVPPTARDLTFEVAPLNFWEATPQAKL